MKTDLDAEPRPFRLVPEKPGTERPWIQWGCFALTTAQAFVSPDGLSLFCAGGCASLAAIATLDWLAD